MHWYASAPSNIALIKYMGKLGGGNVASNSSLSYTLGHLNSHVELEPKSVGMGSGDSWQPLVREGLRPIELSEKGQKRFLDHLQRVKAHFGYRGDFILRSANDFPSDCGLASSASSFAALTLCSYRALRELQALTPEDYREKAVWRDVATMSELSRQGSGSSCRSFYAPWAKWSDKGVEAVDLPGGLHHLVVVVEDGVKQVSSSEAHKRVATSLLAQGRTERAEQRLEGFIKSLQASDWRAAFEIAWAEFWDMHALFETSNPSFGYLSKGSLEVLQYVRKRWAQDGDGPLCTLDAGPNVHLLFRGEQVEFAKLWKKETSSIGFQVMGNI